MKISSTKKGDNVNLLILGNGFDLACGGKTSIFDFVNSVITNPNNAWCRYKINFIILLIYYMSQETDGDGWKEFLNFSNTEINDWMDFEKIVYHLVLDEKTYNLMEDIYNNPTKYIETTDKSAVFSTAHYFKDFRQWHEGLFSQLDSYLEFLEKAVLEFERELQRYLMSIDSDLSLLARKELLLRKLRYKYERTSVMNFNYTRLPEDPIYHPVFRIHGSVGNGCLIGIDPYYKKPGTNDMYKTLGAKIRFTKVYKRLKLSSREELQQFVLRKNINRITFFGHSLGEQDYSYFQSVFDYINLYESEVILVFCYTEYNKEDSVKEVDRLSERVFKLINRYGETLSNKDHGNNLLNKLLLEGRLVFREIFPDDILNEKDLEEVYKRYEIEA